MNRILMTAAVLALTTGAAAAQALDYDQAQRSQGPVARPSLENSPDHLNYQPADPEESARKGTINQPSGEGGTAER